MHKKTIKQLLWLSYILLAIRLAVWWVDVLISQVIGLSLPSRPTLFDIAPPLLDLLISAPIVILSGIALYRLFSTPHKISYRVLILFVALVPLFIGGSITLGAVSNTIDSIEAYIHRASWTAPEWSLYN